MNVGTDMRLVQRFAAAQAGVFAKSDLQSLLAERHPAAFVRRVGALERDGILRRFVRGWYVTGEFSLSVLSQRIAPRSYVSFGTVLADRLLIGSNPARKVMAVKIGKARRYRNLGYEIEHVGVTPLLYFGFEGRRDGVQYADAEKAVLDVLYFHSRGHRYVFDIYSDIAFDKLDRRRLEAYLRRFRNQKFVTFAKRILEISR
jgi:predicted transcriptional regulator of viral defense system